MQDVLGCQFFHNVNFSIAAILTMVTGYNRNVSQRFQIRPESLNGNMIDAPVASMLFRMAFRRSDHLHGWSDARTVAQHYFVDPMSDVSAY